MTYPEGRQPLGADDMAKMHPSRWEDECQALRRDYSLMQIDRNNLRKLLDATEAKADELHDKLDGVEAEAKALRARVQELECDNGRLRAALEWYRDQHRISCKPTIDADWAATRLKTDGGARADAALQKQENE